MMSVSYILSDLDLTVAASDGSVRTVGEDVVSGSVVLLPERSFALMSFYVFFTCSASIFSSISKRLLHSFM